MIYFQPTKLLVACLFVTPAASAFALFTVVPWDMPSDINPHGGNTALMGQQEHIKQNIYQRGNMDLTDLTTGDRIVGVSFRLRNGESGTWPPVDVTFDHYEMYLSTSERPAFNYSTVFSENRGADFLQVRSGSLTVTAGSYERVPLWNPNGGGYQYSPFGPVYMFDQAYTYKGGDLLFEIRHSGNGGVDTDGYSFDHFYNSQNFSFSRSGVGAMTSSFASTSSLGAYTVRFMYEPVPEPVSLLALSSGIGLLLMRKRKRN